MTEVVSIRSFMIQSPVAEMRLIIDVIENQIFVEDLARYWNELFFALIKICIY